MPEYRCYFLDPDNHIYDVVAIDEPTDALASAEGLKQLGNALCHAVEVYDRGRVICRHGKSATRV
jgi:hypothetical protein